MIFRGKITSRGVLENRGFTINMGIRVLGRSSDYNDTCREEQ